MKTLRICAVFYSYAIEYIQYTYMVLAVSTRVDESAVLIGIVKRAKVFFPINQLKEMTDFKWVRSPLFVVHIILALSWMDDQTHSFLCRHRMPKAETQWWMKLRSLLRILAKHTSVYQAYQSEAEGNAPAAEDNWPHNDLARIGSRWTQQNCHISHFITA